MTIGTGATAITCCTRDADTESFRVWVAAVEQAARAADGFVSIRVGVVDEGEFDRSVAVTFATEDQLHRWLDSSEWSALLVSGRAEGIHRLASDVLLVGDQPPGTGVVIFRHDVAAGKESGFIDAEKRLVTLCATFPGFEGAALLTLAEPSGEWLSLLRFRTDRQLLGWLNSPERQQALPTLRSQLTKDFAVITQRTPFGSILRVEDGVTKVTPNWKSAMLVLLVLYPTVMILSRFLGPVLNRAGAEPWLSMWLSQIVSVGLMSFLLMPAVTGLFGRWLDPVRGASPRVTLVGVLVIVVVYAATLTLFATVGWLQFWQHPD